MKLTLKREPPSDKSTIGQLWLNDIWECYILEDVDRFLEKGGIKILGQTAIPRGEYEILLDWSDRFKCLMFRLVDVPQFTGIRIHAGNVSVNTEGCLLPGQTKGQDFVGQSVEALKNLSMKILFAILRGESISIEIV
jgi:hypothetical protein